MSDRFQNQWLGTFQRDVKFERAVELWQEYHTRCEGFDNTRCTGGTFPDGSVRPENAHQLGQIGRNAIAERKRITAIALEEGIDDKTFESAMRYVSRTFSIKDFSQRR